MWGRLATCGRVALGLPTSMQMPTRPSTTRPRVENLPHEFRSIPAIGKLITDYRRAGLLVVSIQVLQEYFAAVVRMAEGDVIAAIELHRLNRISFWDAMIVHAARLAGADILYSEDLQHGAVLGGVRIDNPFLAA